jgi:trehalose-phosphatase
MIQVEGLTYVGSHGIEWSEGLPTTHSVEVAPETAPFVEPATRLLDLATRELSHIPGLLIERKRVGGVIHYRLTADHEQTRQLIFATLGEAAQKSHLTLSEGKKVVEIKAGVAIHKGTALRRFAHARHLKGLVFAGDDRTDLDAILELEQLRQDGISATAIAVQHDDTLPALLAHADLVVQEVPGMAHLLAQIVQQLPQYT